MIKELVPIQLKITREKIRLYADISNDYNPIHIDPDFAAQTPMGSIIAHGTLSLNLILLSIEKTFGAPTHNNHSIDVRFKAPVRENDIVEATGILQTDGKYAISIKNQDGVVVIEGTASINNDHPYPNS